MLIPFLIGGGLVLLALVLFAFRKLRAPRHFKVRQFVIGFDSETEIAADAEVDLIVYCPVLFRPQRIVVEGRSAPAFVINDFRVGDKSQFIMKGSIPADAFASSSFDVQLSCDTAQPTQPITLSVRNLSNSPLRFLAAVFGETVR